MRSMLSHVACLQRKAIRELVLDGEAPLLNGSRLQIGLPYAQRRIQERIARRRQNQAVLQIGWRKVLRGRINDGGFSLPDRRINGQAQVRTGSFEERRNPVSTAENGLAAECFGGPCEADARLEV